MRSPLFSGLIYLVLGTIFMMFAIQHVIQYDWNFFVYILLFFATFDFGSGIRLIVLHFKVKQNSKKE